jgi:general secretion pathway protein A
MYTEFYGLREKPFSLSPDPRFLFLSASHREALAHLLYGIEQGEGFIAITGEVGTGKTTLCRTLLQRLEPGSEIAFLFNPQLSGLELLQAITAEFGLPVEGQSRRELMAQLNDFLLTKKQEGRRVLLLIDEAQNLDSEALEQVRLLSNLETDTQKLIQIVLIGQPELDTMLESPHLRQLRQRISVRWRLIPLSASETREYVRHRLRVAAGKPLDVFTEMALREVHRRSGGIPRIVNRLCDRALLAGYSDGSREIGLAAVAQAQRELEGGGEEARGVGITAERWRFPLGVAAGALVAIAAAAGVWWQQNYGVPFVGSEGQPVAERSRPVADAQPVAERSRPVADAQPVAERSRPVADAPPPARVREVPAQPAQQPLRRTVEAPVAAPTRRAAAPAPRATPFDLGVALAESSPAATTAAALDALLRRWGSETLEVGLLSRSQLVVLLENAGFSVLRLRRGSLGRLRAIGRPALIVLQAIDGAPRVLLLAGLERDTAVLEGLGRPQRVPTDELARFWSGEALVAWRDHAELPRLLRRGDDGPAVQWLQQALGRLGFFGGTPDGVFEASTEAGVRAFQAAEALPVDGKVGPLTKIRLYERLPGYATPPSIAALPASEPTPPRGGTS